MMHILGLALMLLSATKGNKICQNGEKCECGVFEQKILFDGAMMKGQNKAGCITLQKGDCCMSDLNGRLSQQVCFP